MGLHIDLSLSLWARGDHKTTLHGFAAEAEGQALREGHFMFKEMVLEPGAPLAEQLLVLVPPEGEALLARVGDQVKLSFDLTRGRNKRLKITVEPEGV